MNLRDAFALATSRASAVLLAASKRARKIRSASEFNLAALVPTVRSPIVPQGAFGWDLTSIMSARDQQIRGYFAWPVRLAEAMRTDDAIYTAVQNRLAPQRCINVEMQAAKGTGAAQVAKEADAIYGPRGVGVSPETMADINKSLADHGVAVAVNLWTPRPDGSRVDVEIKSWPLEFCWYNQPARCLMTRVDPFPMLDMNTFGANGSNLPPDIYGNPPLRGSNLVPIVHGDGRWIIFQKHDFLPWRQDAALPAACMVWAAHAFAIKDWAKGSASHGNAKVVGELPEGFSTKDGDDLTPEALAFLDQLEAIGSADSPVGIKPFGSKIDFLTNSSRAWEVWRELAVNRERAAHRIYCGTDAAMGAAGDAPGVDIEQLFNVSSTIVQGDLGCIERGLLTGSIEPWAALNFGDSSVAPVRKYQMPDSDQVLVADQAAKQQTAYIEALTSLQSSGIVVTQQICDDLAGAYGAQAITIGALAVEPAAATPAAPPLSVVR